MSKESTDPRLRDEARALFLRTDLRERLQAENGFAGIIHSLAQDWHNEKARNGRDQKQNQGELNQYKGMWYEMIVSLVWLRTATSKRRDGDDPIVAVPLKDRKQIKLKDLWEGTYAQLVADLERDLEKHNVTMIASNPDMLLARYSRLNELTNGLMEQVAYDTDDSALRFLEKLPEALKGRMRYEDICGVLSLKTSLRVDRKVQPLQEANRLKSIRKYIQTRVWNRTDPPFRFYVVLLEKRKKGSERAESSPESFFRNVLLSSITSIDELPARAVDGLLRVFDEYSLSQAINSIKKDLSAPEAG